ncbi:tRNA-binding protein [Halorubrum sp. GN11_10-6_MGM]|uniref:tRNA-binding protein n=1 Tax=Halorubrum sp. GN11_10-6_MGM TaxID=2518112 RepID=UPI0010F92F1E|nr:tRNA-binding protein [Halorubrum sp. GN11_10-6_MGM]TKX74191.1 tRNA-binding protein [Halorubrum sp. GN11_10-6_MGM]
MAEAPFDLTARVAEVSDAEPFPEANKPEMVKLWLDLGEESRQSAAQLGYHHDAADLVGQQVLCVTDLGSIRIAGFNSEALTLGVPGDDGNPVLVTPEKSVPLHGELY